MDRIERRGGAWLLRARRGVVRAVLSPSCSARRPARAVEAVNVRSDVMAIDLTTRRRPDQDRNRPHPGVGGARRRRHRAPHAAAGARGLDQLGGVRARQHRRRADRPADRGAALPHGRLRHPVARPRPVAHRHHHADRPASGRSGRTARPPTSSASRSIPAPSSPTSRSCAPTSCRSSICGSPTPTRTRSTASRSTTASSSASPVCSRCSSPSCSW